MTKLTLIGGVPSSGSTLLMNALSREPDLRVLPETGLFCNGRTLVREVSADLYEPLDLEVPWVNATAKLAHVLGRQADQIAQELERCETTVEFASRCFAPGGAQHLVEKTPENIFAFRVWLNENPDARVVLTARPAQDVVLSLMRRGFSMRDGLMLWFAHTFRVVTLKEEFPDRTMLCTYHQLVTEPEQTLADVAAFIKNSPTDIGTAPSDTSVGLLGASTNADITNVLRLSSWRLEATAWRHSPMDALQSSTSSPDLLGIEFDVFMDALLFDTGTQVCTARELDEWFIDQSWRETDHLSRPDRETPPDFFRTELAQTLNAHIKTHVALV